MNTQLAMNGSIHHTNGHANRDADNHTKQYTNSDANDHANAYSNEHSNGDAKTNLLRLPASGAQVTRRAEAQRIVTVRTQSPREAR